MPENPSVDLTDLSEQDAMAAEWAAALEEKPSDPGAYGTPAPFADFDSGPRGGGAAGMAGGKDLNLIEAEWERGMVEITGNFNLTAMQQAGVVTGGFDNAPFTDMLWSPPHIARRRRA